MKFLLDVCAASQSLHASLVGLGHDVLSARDACPRATDGELLAKAHEERRVLVTEDKDFGELVFLHRRPHPCIVRLVELRIAEKVAVMRELIESHEEAMRESAIIVVTRKQVRIRPGPDS